MLSKSKISLIKSLKIKKFREDLQLFTAEGSKLVLDLLQSSYEVKEIFAAGSWLSEHQRFLSEPVIANEISDEEMSRITLLTTASPVLALVEIPKPTFTMQDIGVRLTLVLDAIRDPGNLGTILRIADWFGIETVICSETTVDLYNPKVIQASMGSIARVRVAYSDLEVFFAKVPDSIPVYGTFLDGRNIYQAELDNRGILIVGNEADGISSEVEKFVTEKIFIPPYSSSGRSVGKAESLNVSVATAIVCSEFRRSIQ